MSLRFNCQNVKNENPMMCKRFVILGDGESTKLSLSLQASPVGMEFRGGAMPSVAVMRGVTGPELLALFVVEGILTMEFERPPAQGEWVDVQVDFLYEGLV
jgi:hypothetical protein